MTGEAEPESQSILADHRYHLYQPPEIEIEGASCWRLHVRSHGRQYLVVTGRQYIERQDRAHAIDAPEMPLKRRTIALRKHVHQVRSGL